jgi:hypothetical protein
MKFLVTLHDTDDNSMHTCNDYSQAKWAHFVVGAHAQGHKYVVGGAFKCGEFEVGDE